MPPHHLLRSPLLTRPSSLLPLRAAAQAFSTTASRPVAKITIVGRLAAEPELVPTSSGQDVIRYALGTSYGPKENKQTSWWKVAAFVPEGGLRDLMMSLGKGSMVYVDGEATMQKFTTKEGNPNTALSIVQRNFELLDKRDHRAEDQDLSA